MSEVVYFCVENTRPVLFNADSDHEVSYVCTDSALFFFVFFLVSADRQSEVGYVCFDSVFFPFFSSVDRVR